MPLKRTYKKRTTKRKVYKKSPFNKSALKSYSSPTMSLGRQGFPMKLKVKHVYSDIISLTSTTGARATQLYIANGLYDPDYTNAGHQPFLFDQLTPLYNHYTVIASKITVKASNNSASGYPMYVGMFLNDDTNVTPTLYGMIEQNDSAHKLIPAGSNATHTMTLNYHPRKAFGGGILNNSLLQGTSAANPSEQQVFTIWAYQPGAQTASVDLDIFIEFVAIWTELKDITYS